MNEFWSGFVKFWQDLGESLKNYFIDVPEGEDMNVLTRWILALLVLILGRYLIKLIMKIARRISGANNKLGVDVSVKTFTLALVNLLLNVLLAFLFLYIINVNTESVASIVSAVTVAIGLSLQDLISAFFSGLVLLKSKNFRTGDYISVTHEYGSCEGTVSSVGLLVSTLETFENQHVVIPNNKLLQSVIVNYSTNPTRRLIYIVDVDYATDIDKCKKVIYDVVKADKRILTNPAPAVNVADLAEFSIKIRLSCYTKGENFWDVYYDVREKILLAFRANDISIPFRRIVLDTVESKPAEITLHTENKERGS